MSWTDEQIDNRIRDAANPRDDRSWEDVCRRARRKRRPLAVAGAVGLAIAVAAPALAFRNDLSELWATAEPDRNLYVRAFADCGEDRFTLEFHPVDGATVRQGDKLLASATHTERTIACDAPIQSQKGEPDSSPYRGETDMRSYTPVTVECSTPRTLRVYVNPIWDGTVIRGTTMGVADRRTRRVFASAVLIRDAEGRNWSRTYWSSDDCATPGGYDRTVPPGVVSPP